MSALPRSDLLLQLLDEVRGLRGEVRALLKQRPPPDAAGEALLAAIWGSAGARGFTAAELIRHAVLADAVELREALGGRNAKTLGRLLRRLEGRPLGALVLYREGVSREGLVWRVTQVSRPQNSWIAPIG